MYKNPLRELPWNHSSKTVLRYWLAVGMGFAWDEHIVFYPHCCGWWCLLAGDGIRKVCSPGKTAKIPRNFLSEKEHGFSPYYILRGINKRISQCSPPSFSLINHTSKKQDKKNARHTTKAAEQQQQQKKWEWYMAYKIKKIQFIWSDNPHVHLLDRF